jgi:UDP-N-acetylglucosamine 2-epimerase (non-hydrolysing)
MIHIVIGTKAQLIKMCMIIKSLDEAGVEYNFVDTGQHQKITDHLRLQFDIRDPDYSFIKEKTNVATTFHGIMWIFRIFFKSLFARKTIFKGDKKGLCLVHGDTTSTLLGAIMGRLAGQRVVHVEAGYRSPKLFMPFPEEIVRRLVDRWSYLNFAFGPGCVANLEKDKVKGRIVNVEENTLIDAVNWAKTKNLSVDLPDSFILVSIHRYETLQSRSRMSFIVARIKELAKENKVVWGLHEPTRKALVRYGLYEDLEAEENVVLREIFDYFDFIQAISRCRFLMTDGGGPQDETRYLGVACLLMRTENENSGHANVCECGFSKEKFDAFMKEVDRYKVGASDDRPRPSKKIVDCLLKEVELTQ